MRLPLLMALALGGLALGAPPAQGQAPPGQAPAGEEDAAYRSPRTADPDVLRALRADDAFRYAEDAEAVEGSSWWSALVRFVQSVLRLAFHPAARPVTYLGLGLVVLWAVLRLLRLEPSRVLRRAAPQVRAGSDMPADLAGADYRARARRARAEGDVRLAVRFLFLHALKTLDEAGRIVYRAEKTNRAYLDEVGDLRHDFELLVRAFEQAWYGHVTPQEARFDALDAHFGGMEDRLRAAR